MLANPSLASNHPTGRGHKKCSPFVESLDFSGLFYFLSLVVRRACEFGVYDQKRKEFVLSIIDRRRFRRIALLRPVTYLNVTNPEPASRLLDISPGGAYIEYPVANEGSVVEMEFALTPGHRIKVTALIRYVVPDKGMGVEFISIDDRDMNLIAELVGA